MHVPYTSSRYWIAALPALSAIAYPWLLRAAHHQYVSVPAWHGVGIAVLLVVVAALLPVLGIGLGWRQGDSLPSGMELRARRFALFAFSAPPLFVLLSFLLSVLGHPIPELVAWTTIWVLAAAWTLRPESIGERATIAPPRAGLRMVHGAVAAALLLFIAFHLANHSLGWLGPKTHARFMHLGRRFYRVAPVEFSLVLLLLGQVILGAWLALRWSAQRFDAYRLTQVATGVYLAFFLTTHLNSALVSARWLRGIDTNWAWASGAPAGLLGDDWNIRLVPHYLLGVFCVLTHLACGLRGVLLAHGWRRPPIDRAWLASLVVAALVASFIVMGLSGLRS